MSYTSTARTCARERLRAVHAAPERTLATDFAGDGPSPSLDSRSGSGVATPASQRSSGEASPLTAEPSTADARSLDHVGRSSTARLKAEPFGPRSVEFNLGLCRWVSVGSAAWANRSN